MNKQDEGKQEAKTEAKTSQGQANNSESTSLISFGFENTLVV